MKNDLYQMDCSAVVYPYFATETIHHSFTMEADLDREIDPVLLRDVVQSMCERFPTMFVRLRWDKFNYKLEHVHDVTPFVLPRASTINLPYDLKNNENLIRVSYRKNRIAVECFHSVTDGSGAITLLKSILAEYYRRLGEEIPNECGVLSPEDAPSARETEDSFRTNYRKGLGQIGRSGRRAFQMRPDGPFEPWHYTELTIPIADLKPVVKASGATIGEFVAALYMFAFYRMREKTNDKRPIILSVPINLRSMFGSETLRNFSLYFLTGVPDGSATFETILEQVKKDFKSGTDKEIIQKMININVAQQDMAVFRYLPRGMKRFVLRIGAAMCGECLFTSTLSNLGVFKVPDALDKHLLAFRAILGPVPTNALHATAYCAKGVFGMTFTSHIQSRVIETEMQKMFVGLGVQATLRDEEELLPIPEKTAE